MGDVIRRGTGIRAGMALKRSDITGKTGTTNDARDTWFNGFNRELVASVWVGFDQEQPLGEGEEGSRTAVPIWTNLCAKRCAVRRICRDRMPPGMMHQRSRSRQRSSGRGRRSGRA